jgi:hypothetical protein
VPAPNRGRAVFGPGGIQRRSLWEWDFRS